MSAARKGSAGRGRRKGAPRPPSESDEGARNARSITVVIDRREGEYVVVVDDAGRSSDVPIDRVPMAGRSEGAILRVPLGAGDAPQWEAAVRDRAEERRRRALLELQRKRLEATDPGGDVVL